MSREELVFAYSERRISRRVFIAGMVAAGVSVMTAWSYAAALDRRRAPVQPNDVTGPGDYYGEYPDYGGGGDYYDESPDYGGDPGGGDYYDEYPDYYDEYPDYPDEHPRGPRGNGPPPGRPPFGDTPPGNPPSGSPPGTNPPGGGRGRPSRPF